MLQLLSSAASGALLSTFGTQEDVLWGRPREREHGDFATSVALQLSKKIGKSPQEIAQVICDAVSELKEVKEAEVAGPGFVNVKLYSSALLPFLAQVQPACSAKAASKDAAPVIVEYSCPNIAKPLGVHHLLSTVIGQAIANLYSHAGYNVIRWNYLGDWGTQFGKLAVALELWGDGRTVSDLSMDELLALYVKFHDEAEKDETLEEKAREAFLKLEQGDSELRALWEAIVATTKNSLNSIYKRLHVSFDLDLGESFYDDKTDAVLEEGISKGVFTEGEKGALIVQFPEEKYPPYLVRKGDGATLYSTRDLAQMRYRIDTYNPQSIFIVTDIAQKLHFEQLAETCHMLGMQMPEFENVLVGRMSFKDVKMSTRKGNILRLSEFLDEAVERATGVIEGYKDSIQADDEKALAEMMGIGAVSYGILSQNRKMDIVFDWDKMLSFEGNSAPYIQYTHARARSVLRKADVSGDIAVPSDIDALSEKERLLVHALSSFSEALEEARSARLPHVLTNYLYSLCQDFNAFYNDDPILSAPEPQRQLRLALTSLCADVLRAGAEILTFRVPDRM